MSAFELGVSPEDVERAFAPFVAESLDPQAPRWAETVRDAERRQRAARWRRLLLGWWPGLRRTQRGIAGGYEGYWSGTSVEEQLSRDKTRPVPCAWGGRAFMAHPQGTKRVHELLLLRALERLGPGSVLEAGCGNGVNLFVLSARMPGVRFAGAELTAGGVQAARSVQALAELPPILRDFSPEPPRDLGAHRRVEFLQADASRLPFADGAFDAVFTCLALEQMEEVRDRALAEIARVAGRHVLLVEPFRDFNEDGLRRDYIVSNDYFSARVSDLERFGLKTLAAFADIPCKIHLGVGLVVAEKPR